MPGPHAQSCALALTTLLVCVSPASAGKFNKVLDIGDPAPAWEALPGVDGKLHSLADDRDSKVVVLIFTRNHCPVSQAYESRFKALARDHKKKEVAVVAINVSRLPGEDLERMRSHARKHEFSFPYLRDDSQRTAEEYGAIATPQVFVLDGKRRVAYMGAFDDSREPDEVEEHYVRDAVAALLAGQEIEIAETLPRGCPIEYEEE